MLDIVRHADYILRDSLPSLSSHPFALNIHPIEGLSDHNMFEGKNSSVGERSMLGVVQEVAKRIGAEQVGYLATFDQMFAGISAALKSAAQSAVLQAEKHLPDPTSDVTVLANRLLKALFLVKYVDTFKATPRNLTVLVYDRFGLDLNGLGKQAQEALNLLESQSYVQRNGNVAVDCTDDVHPEVAYIAALAAKVVGLDIAGIDMVAQDISKPLHAQGGAIVEVNAGPGLLMHLKPAVGAPRPVGQAIAEHLFPLVEDGAEGDHAGRIPIVGVAGTLALLIRRSGRAPLALLAILVALVLVLVRSRFGHVLVAIRENEDRTAMLGYDVARYKFIAFVISGTLSAVSGATYALMFAYAGSTLASIQYSIHPLLWTLLGGASTTLGPMLGTVVMFLLVDFASGFTNVSLLITGAVLIALVLFFPKGILGSIRQRYLKWLP